MYIAVLCDRVVCYFIPFSFSWSMSHPSTVITAHLNADYDALGAIIAAAKLYKNSYLLWPGTQDTHLRDTVHQLALQMPNLVFSADSLVVEEIRVVVVVDTRKRSRLKHLGDKLLESLHKLRVVVYDHHPPAEDDLQEVSELHLEKIGAASSLLTHGETTGVVIC